MRVHWKSVAAAQRADGRVVVLLDFWRADERLARREEALLNPELALPLDAQLRRAVKERAEAIALNVTPPQLDVLAAMAGEEEV